MRLTLLTAALLSTLALPAWGQDCQPYEDMKKWLEGKHQEAVIGSGISDMDRTMVMLFSKADGSTFSVIKVNPQGWSCVVDIGTDWQTRTDPAPVQEEGL